jgi:hypothetical protein
MMTGSIKNIAFLEEHMKDPFGITRIPAPAAMGRPVFARYGRYAGISSACAETEEAAAFLDFLAEKLPAAAEPVSHTEGNALLVKARDMYEAAGIIQDYTRLEGGAELESLLRIQLVPLLEGRSGGADTLSALEKQWSVPAEEP